MRQLKKGYEAELRAEIEKLRMERRGELAEIAAEARRFASHYPQSSDGRNTFIMFAEWVEVRAASAT